MPPGCGAQREDGPQRVRVVQEDLRAERGFVWSAVSEVIMYDGESELVVGGFAQGKHSDDVVDGPAVDDLVVLGFRALGQAPPNILHVRDVAFKNGTLRVLLVLESAHANDSS